MIKIQIDPKFKVKEVFYLVAGFKVIQCNVYSIAVELDGQRQKAYYYVQTFNSPKLMKIDDENSMFHKLEDAKQLALENLEATWKEMRKTIEEITEENFKLPKKPQQQDGKKK